MYWNLTTWELNTSIFPQKNSLYLYKIPIVLQEVIFFFLLDIMTVEI